MTGIFIQALVLLSASVLFAFLSGATMDLRPLIAASPMRARVFASLSAVSGALLLLSVRGALC